MKATSGVDPKRQTLKMEAEAQQIGQSMADALSERDPYDPVDRPKHYVRNGMESLDVIDAFVPDSYSFYMGNVLKYVMRHIDKNGKQDLQKARFYLMKMLEDWA